MDCSPPGSSVHGDSPGKNTGVGCHALLQGISPTQGSNPGLLHYKKILYQLSYLGKLPLLGNKCRERNSSFFLSDNKGEPPFNPPKRPRKEEKILSNHKIFSFQKDITIPFYFTSFSCFLPFLLSFLS